MKGPVFYVALIKETEKTFFYVLMIYSISCRGTRTDLNRRLREFDDANRTLRHMIQDLNEQTPAMFAEQVQSNYFLCLTNNLWILYTI